MGIFISYRRIDTIAWAGRLFDHLSKSFGRSHVFMDIEGGIPRGADFEHVLTSELARCDALLVLIGPEWINCRRLDAPDDWVRNEIATSLRRNVMVVPVLLGKAGLPKHTELPDELRPLLTHQCAEISDTRWDYDVGELVKDLTTLAPLKLLHDVASANTGIRLLKDLMEKTPAIADAVGRSREVIENAYRQVDKLELFKTIHDALHTIEFACLRPIQAGRAGLPLRPFATAFTAVARRIRGAIDEYAADVTARDDLIDRLELDRLKLAEDAFQVAVDAPSETGHVWVVNELDRLLSAAPPKLNIGISDAAKELNLNRLVELMTKVRETLTPVAGERDAELEPLLHGIDALGRLRDELTRRVVEHTYLQRLDSKVRTVCVGGAASGAMASEWRRIKLQRSRLTRPFSAELEAMNDDLVAAESDIEAALARGAEQAAQDLLQAYFASVSIVFRDVNESLRAFCMRLSKISQPLKTVLDMV